MEERAKNIILGLIYAVILFLIIFTLLNSLVMYALSQFVIAKVKSQAYTLWHVEHLHSLVPIIEIIEKIIAATVTFIVLYKLKVQRITEFLRPNRFRVNATATIAFLYLLIAVLDSLEIIGLGNIIWRTILVIVSLGEPHIYTKSAVVFILWPIIGYYIIFGLIDKYFLKKEVK